jgi:hypothetical protein
MKGCYWFGQKRDILKEVFNDGKKEGMVRADFVSPQNVASEKPMLPGDLVEKRNVPNVGKMVREDSYPSPTN